MDDNGQAQLSDIGIHEALRVDNFNSAWRYRRHSSAYADDVWLEITPEDDVYALAALYRRAAFPPPQGRPSDDSHNRRSWPTSSDATSIHV